MTDKPFGVNLTILPSIKPPPYAEYRQAIIESGIKIVETAGNKPQEHVDEFKKHGIKVIHKCTSVRHALSAERMGVDAISIDGFECAGHPGEDDIPGLILIPAAADKVKIPMIASGGFGDAPRPGRGAGARRRRHQHGHPLHVPPRRARSTRREGADRRQRRARDRPDLPHHAQHRPRGQERDQPSRSSRWRRKARSSRTSASWSPAPRGKKVYATGDTDAGIWSAGQVQGLIHDIPTCAELVRRIVREAEADHPQPARRHDVRHPARKLRNNPVARSEKNP